MKVTEISPGSPCWTQLSTSDVEAAKKFYGQLFGWTAETDPRPEVGGYTTFHLDGAPVAAVAPLMDPRQPVRWMLSFDSKDIDATTAAAEKAGAQVWMKPMDVLDIGRWSLLSDPTGAAFSLWQAGKQEEAIAAVPDDLALQTAFIGTDEMVLDRLRAYRDAGVTTVRLNPGGDTPSQRLDTLARGLDLIRKMSAEQRPADRARES